MIRDITKRCSFKIQDLDKCSDQELVKIKADLGEVIYATRNRIVHALMAGGQMAGGQILS